MKQRATTLEIDHVVKTIRRTPIIKDISFSVLEGEVFGFLGPNGSGKTTTIRMMVGLIRPTAGRIRICGYDVQTQHAKALAQVGSIVENPELYPFLTGMENLEQFARMLPDVKPEKIREVIERVDLKDRIYDKVKDYSLGMRQRLGIAQALLGDPKLLILDEPTNGLDPQGIKDLRAFIRQLASEGLSVFISSHLLSEIQLMCDRVAIINKGKILRVGEVHELLTQEFRTIVWHGEPGGALRQFLTASPLVRVREQETAEGGIITDVAPEHIAPLNAALVAEGIAVQGIEWKKPSLEELFLDMTEGERHV